MKSKWLKFGSAVGLLALSALACSAISPAAPTPFAYPTPNATLTALFSSVGTPAYYQPSPESTKTEPPAASQTPTTPTDIPVVNTDVPPQPTQIAPTNTSLPTRLPTETPFPTAVSYAGPAMRPALSILALRAPQPIVLDGIFGEWDTAKASVDAIVAGGANWRGPDDASGKLMVSWDPANLYVAVRVKDDFYAQQGHSSQIYKGDSVEILMDTNVPGDFYYAGLNGDDFQLGISPGSPQPGVNPEVYLWLPKGEAGDVHKVSVAAMATDDGYRLEAAIPWSVFGVKPRAGQHFGFAFSISDNDRANENLQQSLVSTAPGRSLVDPTTWHDLTLSGSYMPMPAPGPTANPGPSATPKPVNPTPTLVDGNGAAMEAVYFSSPPALDGNFNEWLAKNYPVRSVVFGAESWQNAGDLSGTAMFGWDAQNLYIAAQVVDDYYVQTQTGESLFLGDSLEILFDENLGQDIHQHVLNGDDFQLGISPGRNDPGRKPEAFLWYPREIAGSRPQVRIAVQPVANGYLLEAAIPWSVFGTGVGPGDKFGFAFSISDNDNPNRPDQEKMVSTAPDRELTDPATWGTLMLVK